MGSTTNCGKSRSKVDIVLFIGKFAIAIATALGISLTSIKMTSMFSAWSELHLEKSSSTIEAKATEVFLIRARNQMG